MAEFSLSPATFADLDDVRRLFRAYAQAIEIELDYQNFEAELDSLPGKYEPPKGALFIAKLDDGTAIGCVALRRLEAEGTCEMKRLYVAPRGRGLGIGKALAQRVMDEAVRLGYTTMLLDTLPSLETALAMYRQFGFVQIPPYYDSPVEETIFMRREL